MPRYHSTPYRDGARPSVLDQTFADAISVVAELFIETVQRRASAAQFLQTEDVLAALPLPTREFALAVRRLDNALYYYNRDEFGGCMYELWQLVRRLRNHYGLPADTFPSGRTMQ
jgi:hypothetical protein